MDVSMMLIEYTLSLAITAFVYMLAPVIILITGKKYKPSAIKMITVINGFACFIIFSIIKIEMGYEGANIRACLTWSFIAYWLLHKKCSIETNAATHQNQPEAHEASKPIRFCVHCGAELNYNAVVCVECGCAVEPIRQPFYKKLNWKIVCNVVVSLLLIASVVANLALYKTAEGFAVTVADLESVVAEEAEKEKEQTKKIRELQKHAIELESDMQEYLDFWNDNQEKVNLMNERIVFIVDETNYYHKYECPEWSNGYILLVDDAKERGYEPCDHCFHPSFSFSQEYFSLQGKLPTLP